MPGIRTNISNVVQINNIIFECFCMLSKFNNMPHRKSGMDISIHINCLLKKCSREMNVRLALDSIVSPIAINENTRSNTIVPCEFLEKKSI